MATPSGAVAIFALDYRGAQEDATRRTTAASCLTGRRLALYVLGMPTLAQPKTAGDRTGAPRRNLKPYLVAAAVGVALLWLITRRPAIAMRRLAKKLTAAQKANATIIAQEFAAAGLHERIGAAAIVNAWHESGLRAGAVGDGGHSIGLFQLHDKGGGHGLTAEFRANPRNNAKTILAREVLAKRGKRLRQRAADGAGVGELAAIFSRDIERPADVQGNMAKRKATAEAWFPTMA
jgi:hypothetical protein